LGVRFFAFDSKEELEKIARYAPGSNVYLRLGVSNSGSQIKLSSKFGCNKSGAVNLMRMAKEHKLSPLGITFHVGSQAETLDVWGQAINDVADIMKDLQHHGIRLEFLNLGGGFPVSYGREVPHIKEIAKEINKAKKKLPYSLGVWCEPGRYLVAGAGTIRSHVIGRALRGKDHWLYLDTGRFQSFIELFESEDIRYPVSCESKHSKKMPFTLTGPTCDSYDTIMHNVLLSKDIEIGDTISFGMCGAYTHVYGAPFNDFPVPVVRYNKT
jgi:ornithine decarboxylase